MQKKEITIKKEDIPGCGLFQYDFDTNEEYACENEKFIVKENIVCDDNVLFEKGSLIPFFCQYHNFGEKTPGVVLDFRKDGFRKESLKNEIKIDFEYEILTEDKKKKREQELKLRIKENKEKRKHLPFKRQVTTNLVNIINKKDKQHIISMKDEGAEKLLFETLHKIDFLIIITSLEIKTKFEITSIVDEMFPVNMILCIKEDMSSETVVLKDFIVYE